MSEILGATAAIVCVSLWLRALADAARRDDSDFAGTPFIHLRLAWIALIGATGPIGALVYYVVARPHLPELDVDLSRNTHDR